MSGTLQVESFQESVDKLANEFEEVDRIEPREYLQQIVYHTIHH